MRIDRILLEVNGLLDQAKFERGLKVVVGDSYEVSQLSNSLYALSILDSPEKVIDFVLSLKALAIDLNVRMKGLEVPAFKERYARYLKHVDLYDVKTLMEVTEGDDELIKDCYPLLKDVEYDTLYTIKMYIESGHSPTLTAKRLYVHRNTVTYRVDRFETETGLNIKVYSVAMFIYRVISSYLVSVHQGGM